MDVNLVGKVGERLKGFLGRISDCINRSEPRGHLETSLRGTDFRAEAQERRTDGSGSGHTAADVAVILRAGRVERESSARPDAAAGRRAARPSQGDWRH